jgi:SAM-dependent methyltransferase
MPDLRWNTAVWDRDYRWKDAGEEWSGAWGGSEAQWFGALYPRLHRFLPARKILEIAPGYGRWTKFLLETCDELVGVDLSARCVENCRKRFASDQARFVQNDGLSLAGLGTEFDLIFSFDSLVHAEIDVLDRYVPQMITLLSRHGVGFIHHSNFANVDSKTNPHQRASSVSAEGVAGLIAKSGGVVLHQEVINWARAELTDCLTLFARNDGYPAKPATPMQNSRFMDEARLIRDHVAPYCRIERLP